jgi:hypothetical protein
MSCLYANESDPIEKGRLDSLEKWGRILYTHERGWSLMHSGEMGQMLGRCAAGALQSSFYQYQVAVPLAERECGEWGRVEENGGEWKRKGGYLQCGSTA